MVLKKIKIWLKGKIIRIYENKIGSFYFKQKGFCPCCDTEVYFVAKDPWLRDYFTCQNCHSLPRERALMHIVEQLYPNWTELNIHESSPGNRGHSIKLRQKCKSYSASHFYGDMELGAKLGEFENQDLENLTFENNTFDIVVTSDVMEHIYDPEQAFKEINRVLKPGGAHIFSVPLINKHKATERWAEKGENGDPIFLHKPEWHGNPIDEKGSPVTMHWGYDITAFIESTSGAEAWIEYINDLKYGIRAEYIEIVVQKKVKS